MVRRFIAVVFLAALSGCGLLLATDPPANGAFDGGVGLDGAGLREAGPARDGGPPVDAIVPSDAALGDGNVGDGGVLTARCLESASFREERFVAAGLIDVAARGDEVAVVYHWATDRAYVEYLDGTLAPVAAYPWDGALDPSRLTVSDRGFAMLANRPMEAWLVEPPGGVLAIVTGDVTAAGLSRYDAAFPTVGALLYGPSFAVPTLLELDTVTRMAAARPVPVLGDGSEVVDARLEHDASLGAYVAAYAEGTSVHLAAFGDASLALRTPPVPVTPTGAAASPPPDLSLAISGDRAAVAMRVVHPDGSYGAAVALADITPAVRQLYAPADLVQAAAVASRTGSPAVGVARIVGGALEFELRDWADGRLIASVAVAAPTEGDLLDLEAEPTEGSFLVARKRREGGGAVTVTRIRCTLRVR